MLALQGGVARLKISPTAREISRAPVGHHGLPPRRFGGTRIAYTARINSAADVADLTRRFVGWSPSVLVRLSRAAIRNTCMRVIGDVG